MKLLGATPFFEIYLVEAGGELTIYHRYGGDKESAPMEYSERMTLEGSWREFHEEFETLDQLQLRIEQLVLTETSTDEPIPVSHLLAEKALPVLRTLNTLSEKQRTFIERLLEIPSVKQDESLQAELTGFLVL